MNAPKPQDSPQALETRRFRMDTTVNITHILTTIGLIVAIFSWGGEVKSTLIKHDGDINYLKEAHRDNTREVKEELRELNRKIDKLVDDERTHYRNRNAP